MREVSGERITARRWVETGEAFTVVDGWTVEADAHKDLGKLWTGKTEFNRVREEADVGAGEGRVAKPRPNTREPSRAEREAHELTHIPYRSWCRHCVRGKAVEDPHRKSTDCEERGGDPRISMDYVWLGMENGEDAGQPLLALHDDDTKGIKVRTVPAKGAADRHTVR